MNKLHLVLLLTLIVSLINECNDRKNQKRNFSISKNCIDLNNRAFTHIQRYTLKKETVELDTALFLLKRAVECDSNSFAAYKNMADVYGYLHQVSTEIQVYNKLIQLRNGDPIWMIAKGNLYKEIHMADSAKMTFSNADAVIEQRLKKYPDNINLLFDKILLEFNSNGKSEAMRTLKEEIKKYPKDSTELNERAKYLPGDNQKR